MGYRADIDALRAKRYDREDGAPLQFDAKHLTREGAALEAERIARHV